MQLPMYVKALQDEFHYQEGFYFSGLVQKSFSFFCNHILAVYFTSTNLYQCQKRENNLVHHSTIPRPLFTLSVTKIVRHRWQHYINLPNDHSLYMTKNTSQGIYSDLGCRHAKDYDCNTFFQITWLWLFLQSHKFGFPS